MPPILLRSGASRRWSHREQAVQRLLERWFESGKLHVQTTLGISGADIEARACTAAAFEHDLAMLPAGTGLIGQRNRRAAMRYVTEDASEALCIGAECD
jgi:hypothetical protein